MHTPSALFCAVALALLPAIPAIADDGAADPPAATPQVRFNQIGFHPGASKLAVVEGRAAGRFDVIGEGDGQVVLEGELAPAAVWRPAGRSAAIADLSDLPAGRYRLRLDGSLRSDPLVVTARPYADLADAALKGFYFNRAGTALDAAHAGRHARAAGHPDTQVRVHASAASAARPAGSVISAPRGWYDAGDYNKYVVNSGITLYTLLAAWEDFPEFFRARDAGIPESGNAVPDLLDEAWWNLRWMLEMQDPADGGVYHKLTNLRFDGAVMPEAAREPRYVVQKTTAAALDLAAVMAMAARVYAPYEAQYPGEPERMRAVG